MNSRRPTPLGVFTALFFVRKALAEKNFLFFVNVFLFVKEKKVVPKPSPFDQLGHPRVREKLGWDSSFNIVY